MAARALPFAEKIDEILTSSDDNMVARRMSLIAFAIRLISAAIAFVSQILLARWLGDFEYGIFVLVWTAAIIAGNLSCFGFATSIIRFVPQYRASGSHDELRGILLTGRIFTLLAATAVATFGIGATFILAGNHRKLLCCAIHSGRNCAADDCARRHAGRHGARQRLAGQSPVADLYHPPAANSVFHGGRAGGRL